MKCPRCTWTSAPADQANAGAAQQLAGHATDAGHPLCSCCSRILLIEEQQTCGDWPKARPDTDHTCVARGHELLSGVLTAWADLHGEPRTWPRTSMLGPGGSGDMPRRLTSAEQRLDERWWLPDRIGPLPRMDWLQAEAARYGKEHLIDNLPTDPPAIEAELSRWEDDWRHERGEPAATVGGGHRALRAAATYLDQHMRWAGRQHPAFAEFLDDMTILHARCEAAVGRAPVKPETLDVACLDCGTLLQHPLVDIVEEKDGRRWTGPAIDKRARQCPNPNCRSRYDDTEDGEESNRYRAAKAETARRRSQVLVDGEIWQQITRIAHDLGRPRQTVYAWVNQGLVRSFEEKGLVFAHVDDVTQLHLERPMQQRRTAS